MSKHSSLATVASEAIDQLQLARTHLAWLDSLSFAILRAMGSGHDHHAQQLADLTQYLAADLNNVLDGEVSSLNERLLALDLRT